MHNQQQQHLKTNNVSKFAVITLSIVLLSGISLVPAFQIAANEQVQHQHQQQHLAFGQTAEEPVSGEQTFMSAFESNVFAPGETFLLYVEPVGYSYGNVTDENGDQLYTMNFTADFTISDPNGTILAGQEDLPLSNLVSHHQNKELMLQTTIGQTSPFPPGDYVLRYTFTDENSGKSFDITKDVTVQEG